MALREKIEGHVLELNEHAGKSYIWDKSRGFFGLAISRIEELENENSEMVGLFADVVDQHAATLKIVVELLSVYDIGQDVSPGSLIDRARAMIKEPNDD